MKNLPNYLYPNYEDRLKKRIQRWRWQSLHIDPVLIICLLCLSATGLFILYSASNQNNQTVLAQGLRIGLGFLVMIGLAQIPPRRYYQWAPWLFSVGVFLLIIVLLLGKMGHGAQRWLALGPIRFQPSEVMKLAMPMMLAWFLNDKPLPPSRTVLLLCTLLILIPSLLVAKQPDLGTAILIAMSGCFALFLSGLSYKIIGSVILLFTLLTPILMHFMHDYQRDRVLTFLHPERDPLGAGYHIIQSKIAIGSGGSLGKGWLQGTQSHLQFLPEHATDFIFAVSGEELGYIGSLIILGLFILILARLLYISSQAQSTFTRLLSSSLSLTFVFCALINIGMVIGILPVVGVPLPLISYGGTSIVTMMACFGIIMSIHTHKKLLSS
ncbi:MAG: rod shape-determining protein RodA [Gammaproteobacteria bacterium RIFCSPHIGHO2_12_FULL_41_15]|nr:MAG: rod shape-determining protein RodA [Gammaproteobacteria bacterium RIFCSPHIGHO2_12_FULL_41_15]